MKSGHWGKIFINNNFRQVGAQNVGTGFQKNRAQRNRHLPFIWAQITDQPLHEPAVVSLA